LRPRTSTTSGDNVLLGGYWHPPNFDGPPTTYGSGARPFQILRPETATVLFGFLLLLQAFDLAPLLFDFSLLGFDLALSLLCLYLLILQRVAEQEATARPQRTAYSGACPWSADCGANYGAGRRTCQGADSGTFFTRAQRLPRASRNRKHHHQCNSDSD
jgi:hypothetical protein